MIFTGFSFKFHFFSLLSTFSIYKKNKKPFGKQTFIAELFAVKPISHVSSIFFVFGVV